MVSNPLRHIVSGIAFLSLWRCSQSACSTPTRTRRPWHSLSDYEQMLFVNGFQEIHRNSVLISFLMAHEKATESDAFNIHTTSENFYWHSYWLYELENSFRDLGEEYECFTLPYWDVTHDAGVWAEMEDQNIADLPIYNSNLGGDGDAEHDNCVTDHPWADDDYFTEFLCADDEDSCCLKRLHLDNSTLEPRSAFSNAVFLNKSLEDYQAFFDDMNTMHGHIHQFIGTVANTHFHPEGGKPAVDPLFPVFHAFIDYIRLMRTDCWDFDLVPVEDLEKHEPYAFTAVHGHNTTLDYKMDFSILCDETGGKSPRLCSYTDITPRFMFDVSPNRVFKIVYELGDFWNENAELKAACADNLNSSWWSNAMINEEDTESNPWTDGYAQFVSDRVVESANHWTSTTMMGPVVFMVLGIVLVALWRHCAVRTEKEKLAVVNVADSYGTL